MIHESANQPLAASVMSPLSSRPLALAISSLLLSGALAGSVQAQVFPAVVKLTDLDGSSGFRLDGTSEYDYSGFSVSGVGDINGDGIDDLIIGALGADPNGSASGSSYVVFGRDGSAEGDFPSILALSSLDGSTGFRIDGVAQDDYSGLSVSAAGDVNGDGIDDLIIGAPAPYASASGSSYVVFGRNVSDVGNFAATLALSSLDGSNGFRLDAVAVGDRSGYSVGAAGDINGDGVDDVIIGAYRADPGGNNFAGSSYVVFGRNVSAVGEFSATLALSSLDGSNGFRLDGVAQYDYSGFSVSAAGDINGDGIDDLIIGAYGADPGGNSYAGSSYVVFGRDVSVVGNFSAILALSSLNGSHGFRLDGVAGFDYSGFSVSAAGDINGDGLDDLVIGAFGADPDGKLHSGSSYVVFGRDVSVVGNFPPTLALSSLDGSNGFRLDGVAEGDRSGYSVSAAGDIDGDGIDDLVIGAVGARPDGNGFAGSSYVVFGSAGSFPAILALSSLDGSTGFRLDGVADSDLSGSSVSAAGDINGDGVDDLVIGANGADPAGNSSGSSYVVFGGGTSDVIFADGFEYD